LIASGLHGDHDLTAMSLADPSSITGASPSTRPCGAVAVSSQGGLAVACEDHHVYRLDPASLAPIWKVEARKVSRLAFSPDGSMLAIAAYGGLIVVHTGDGSTYQERLSAGQKIALSARFSPDGARIVVGWHTGLNVYDVASRRWTAQKRLAQLPKFRARHLDVSPDGNHVILGGDLLRMSDILATGRGVVPAINPTRFSADVIFAGDSASLYVPNDATLERVSLPAPAEEPPAATPPTAPPRRAPRARLTVEPTRATSSGGKVEWTIRNVGDGELRVSRPGGAAGCAALQWKAAVSLPRSVFFWNRSPKAPCAKTTEPSATIVIGPGEIAGKVTVNPGDRWELDDSHAETGAPTIKHAKGAPLPAGTYQIEFRFSAGGPWGPVEATLEVKR
jgi:hypothetical protein